MHYHAILDHVLMAHNCNWCVSKGSASLCPSGTIYHHQSQSSLLWLMAWCVWYHVISWTNSQLELTRDKLNLNGKWTELDAKCQKYASAPPRHLLPHVLQKMPRNPKYDQFQSKGNNNEENPESMTKMAGNPKFDQFQNNAKIRKINKLWP